MGNSTRSALYDSYDDAARTVRDLEAAGIPSGDISVVSNHADKSHVGVDAGAGAAIGTAIGGGAGLLAGLGMLAIPGIGPVVAAGWLIATAAGAAVGATAGAATGGIVGSLVDAGVERKHAHLYAEGVRRGGSLVTVRVDADNVQEVESILNGTGSVDLDAREAAYRASGWTEFDERATAYTEAEMAKERSLRQVSL